MTEAISIQFPPAMQDIFTPARYKVYYGGRGSSKSWTVAQFLIVQSLRKKCLILCAREHQTTLAESVHRLLSGIIDRHNLGKFFKVTQTNITSITGSEFIFKGLAQNVEGIKSMEGVDYCWVEEAEKVSTRSWDVLIPTIRKPGSEILIVFNPADEHDATYQRFIVNTPPDMIRRKVNYVDNPWFPDVLRKEMEHLKSVDYERYSHVWEGELRSASDAQIFKGHFVVEPFSSGGVDLFRYGMDFGHGPDPSCVIRCFVRDRKLFIDHEAMAYGLDLKDLPALICSIPGARRSQIWCDCSRPETIGYLNQAGDYNDWSAFNCIAAPKWPESVMEGIEFIKSFDKVVIHPRCVNTQYEFRAYSFKIDKNTDEVLPVIKDGSDHCVDSLRYSLSPIIKRRSSILDSL